MSVIKSTLLVSGGTALSQVILFLGVPFISRYLGPSLFAEYSIFVSLVYIFSVVSSFRFEMLFPKCLGELNDHKLNTFLEITFLSIVVMVLISLVALLLLGETYKYFLYLTITIVVFSLTKGANFWAVYVGEYRCVARSKVLVSFLTIVFQIISIIFLDAGLEGLIISFMFAWLVGLLFYITSLKHTYLKQVFFKSRIRSTFNKHGRELGYDSLAALFNVASIEGVTMALFVLFEPSVAGLYAINQRLLTSPITLVSQSISQVYFGFITKEKDASVNFNFCWKVVLLLSLVSILPLIIVSSYGESLYILFLGKEWSKAGELASVLIFSYMAQFIFVAISSTYVAKDASVYNLYIQVVLFISRVSVLMLGFYFDLDTLIMFQYFAIASATCYLIGVAMALIILKKEIGDNEKSSNN